MIFLKKYNDALIVKIKSKDKKRIQDMAKKAGYPNVSEFVRDCLLNRERLQLKEIWATIRPHLLEVGLDENEITNNV